MADNSIGNIYVASTFLAWKRLFSAMYIVLMAGALGFMDTRTLCDPCWLVGLFWRISKSGNTKLYFNIHFKANKRLQGERYLEEVVSSAGGLSLLRNSCNQPHVSISLLGWTITSSWMETVYFPSHFIFLFPCIVLKSTRLNYNDRWLKQ